MITKQHELLTVTTVKPFGIGVRKLSVLKKATLSTPKRRASFAYLRTRKCPDCGRSLQLFPINTNAGNRVEGNFKSMWFCTIACGYEKYLKETVNEVVETLKIRVKRFSKEQRRKEYAGIKWGKIKPCCK